MDDSETARKVLNKEVIGDKIALLTTAGAHGQPHATWMATFAFHNGNEIITLSSPDSLKVKNIAKNHHVEWLFTSSDFTYLIYFTGKAKLNHDPKIMKQHWNLLPDKSRAYFLEGYNSPPGFITICTSIEKAVLSIPTESRSVELDVATILQPAD
ncbi:MAG: pyridoxamine 5'-phosphate oxidase family protein [Verrucomicrobiales bacterium]|nr:pyridoxamine 5'-phosphate oxidase family protein [Verrucomicrobiales bacterium]